MKNKRHMRADRETPSLRKRIRENRIYYLMLAPFAIIFIVFLLIPVLSSVALSFTSFNMLQIPRFIGISNYVRLILEDEVFVKALQNTIMFAIITGPVGYILSFAVAWLINEMNRHVRNILALIMYAPTLAGNIYFIWLFIFADDSKGFMNNALMRLGVIQDPIMWLTNDQYNFGVVILVIVWSSLGAGFLSFVAGFQSLDRSFFEAAAIDGVKNRFQELYYVTLPQMGPQMMFGAVMSISGAFAIGYQNMALTGFPSANYATHTLLLHMLDFGSRRFEMGYSSAIAVVLFIMMLSAWLLINKLLRKFSAD